MKITPYRVLDQWNNNKVVYSGSKEQCVKYIQSNNNYQCNYSQLILDCDLVFISTAEVEAGRSTAYKYLFN